MSGDLEFGPEVPNAEQMEHRQRAFSETASKRANVAHKGSVTPDFIKETWRKFEYSYETMPEGHVIQTSKEIP